MKKLATVILALLGNLAVAADPGQLPDSRRWATAVNSGDAAVVADLYAADAVLVTPGLEIISTAGAIADFLLSPGSGSAGDLDIAVIDSRREGDTLYQSAVWVATVTRHGIDSTLDGAMNSVYALQPDGSWKITLQHWN